MYNMVRILIFRVKPTGYFKVWVIISNCCWDICPDIFEKVELKSFKVRVRVRVRLNWRNRFHFNF